MPVVLYPFELRTHGNTLRLSAAVEVMTNDGAQVESEAPRGEEAPRVYAWTDPAGHDHRGERVEVKPEAGDGRWTVLVPIVEDTMMRVDVEAEVL